MSPSKRTKRAAVVLDDSAVMERVADALGKASAPLRALQEPIAGALRAAALGPTIEASLINELVIFGNGAVTQARLAGEAKRSLLSGHEVLTAPDVSALLGSKSDNPRQFANTRRKQGALLGVPVANYFVYPAFQFDRARHKVHPQIAAINAILAGEDDAYGVFSWWVTPNARLADARAPYQLLGTARASQLPSLAQAVTDLVG
ncbi:MAG TPA: hypothetical protein VGM88_14540 [Kofleriaceae bacterium]|jgi:hypothetical protein